MSSTPATPDAAPRFGWRLAYLRRSMVAQIALAIALVSVLLVAGTCYFGRRVMDDKLREVSESLLSAGLSVLQEDLAAVRYAVGPQSQRLARRRTTGLGPLAVELLDQRRVPIVASENFPVPVAALPDGAWAADVASADQVPMTTLWIAPDKRGYRVLLASLPVPADAPLRAGERLHVALALDLTMMRKFVDQAWEVLVFTLVVCLLAAALYTGWITRRILIATRRLGAATNRISAKALDERLDLDRCPAELEDVALAFNRMLERLQAAFDQLSNFSSELAHDLRTPINSLLGEAQVTLSKARSAEEYRGVIESSVDSYERITRLINNMLFLARADHAQAATRRDWIELAPRLERVSEFFELLAEERGVGVRSEINVAPGRTARVWADDTLINRALGNLISNALRFARAGTPIVLSATVHDNGSCTVAVSNEGPPITLEHQREIFRRRFRLDDALGQAEPGSGLGLAIVKSIMEMHGGLAGVTSAPGQPTVFRLWFPAPEPGLARAVARPVAAARVEGAAQPAA